MNKKWFEQQLENLPDGQRKVLDLFLANKTDTEIASALEIKENTVRRHISKIYKAFYLTSEGSRPKRIDLLRLFAEHKPELVQTKDQKAHDLANPETDTLTQPVQDLTFIGRKKQ